jgi:hypothetical protein
MLVNTMFMCTLSLESTHENQLKVFSLKNSRVHVSKCYEILTYFEQLELNRCK